CRVRLVLRGRLLLGEAALDDRAREHADQASLLEHGRPLDLGLLEQPVALVEREVGLESQCRRVDRLRHGRRGRVEPLGDDPGDERVRRHDPDQHPGAVDDEHGAHVRPAQVPCRLLDRRLHVEGGRVGEHPVADEAHGNRPLASRAAATSRMPVTRAAWRRVRSLLRESSHTRSKASLILSASFARMSSRFQKRRPRSCTHSKYETVTPPAFVRMSGSTGIPRSAKIASASSDVGPFAPSAIMRALTRGSFAAVSWSSSAARTRMSQGSSSSSSFVRCSPGNASSEPLPCSTACAWRAATSSPCSSWIPPETSEIAVTSAPRSASSSAATPPTLPKPWTTQRSPDRSQPSRSQARSITITTPAPVASARKTDPPIAIGFPVTISGTAWPTCIEYVSIIHAIVCSSVAMSGAAMS